MKLFDIVQSLNFWIERFEDNFLNSLKIKLVKKKKKKSYHNSKEKEKTRTHRERLAPLIASFEESCNCVEDILEIT